VPSTLALALVSSPPKEIRRGRGGDDLGGTNSMSSESEVKRILWDQLSVDESEIVPMAELRDDLGMDDLASAELKLTFEEAFKLLIPDQDFQKCRTVQDIVDYVDERRYR
jgi:acyl carrier protein